MVRRPIDPLLTQRWSCRTTGEYVNTADQPGRPRRIARN